MGIDVINVVREHSKTQYGGGFILSEHAANRMCERNVNRGEINSALKYGRVTFNRGAKIYAIGRKEIEFFKQHEIDLIGLDGVQVIVSPDDEIITVYRNNDFRGLRPNRKHQWKPARKKRYDQQWQKLSA